jgi:hypothetical protein
MDIVPKADAANDSQSSDEPRIVKSKECAPDPCSKQKDYSSSTDDNTIMRGSLIRSIDYIEPVCNAEID